MKFKKAIYILELLPFVNFDIERLLFSYFEIDIARNFNLGQLIEDDE